MKQVLNVDTIRRNMRRFKGHPMPYLFFATVSRCVGCKHPVPSAGVCNGVGSVTPY